jgi:GT2 family glycosyltransferase
MTPLVSILIPAWNADRWIADTIRSALNQTWRRREIVIVDDGSSDQTLAIAQQFASKEVFVVTQANQGAAAARNRAFASCQGDYVQWLDADDLLAPDKISRQMEVVAETGDSRVLLSSAWGRFMHRPHRASFVATPLWCDLTPLEWLLRKLERNVWMQTATWLVSRPLTEAAGPWNTQLLGDDDGEYFCRVVRASTGVRFVPEAKVYYRIAGPGSLSDTGRSERKMEALFLSTQMHIECLRSMEDSERVRRAAVKYLQSSLPFFYPERPDIIDRAARLAAGLGGQLQSPHLSWKYVCLETAFGWRLARRAQLFARHTKVSLAQHWDKALYRLENRTAGVTGSPGR